MSFTQYEYTNFKMFFKDTEKFEDFYNFKTFFFKRIK